MTIFLSPVLRAYGHGTVAFMCPGCSEVHCINVENHERPRWGYNGNSIKPTFTPSILVKTGRALDPNYKPDPDDPPEICHSFVTDGRIQFLGDCSHELAGQTVDLPPFET